MGDLRDTVRLDLADLGLCIRVLLATNRPATISRKKKDAIAIKMDILIKKILLIFVTFSTSFSFWAPY